MVLPIRLQLGDCQAAADSDAFARSHDFGGKILRPVIPQRLKIINVEGLPKQHSGRVADAVAHAVVEHCPIDVFGLNGYERC